MVQVLVHLFTILSIPLVIFGNQNYLEAIIKSVQLFLRNPFIIIFASLVGGFGCMLGFFVLCIGIFFTIPYIFSVEYAIYDNGVGFDKTSPIDEIGLE